MSALQRVGDLEIAHDVEFQQKSWRVQRVGWIIMTLLIVGALLGVFGGEGLLNAVSAGEQGDALTLQHRRFERVLNLSHVQIEVNGAQGEARVWISHDYLDSVQIDGITPQPEESIGGEGRTTFVFRVDGGNARITFDVKPQRVGALSGQIGVEGGTIYDLQQFIYP